MSTPDSQHTQDPSSAMIDAAVSVAKNIHAKAILMHFDVIHDLKTIAEKIKPITDLILVARDETEERLARDATDKILRVPDLDLTRMAQIKMTTLMAFSQRMLEPEDTFLFLVGVRGQPLDTLVTMTVGREFELFYSVDQPRLTEHIKRVVFQQVLTIALELASEGREGKSVGALFVIGDPRQVQIYCQQNIINPFKGCNQKERNILNESMKNTVKEFANIDGAFIVKGNGVIVSAGTTLRPNLGGDDLPQGLGARHATAAAITASTRCIAITLSQSTGTVRVWRQGQMITEIERTSRPMPPHAPRITE